MVSWLRVQSFKHQRSKPKEFKFIQIHTQWFKGTSEVKSDCLLGCDIGGAKELGVMYFPTNWGAKEPQNLPNHRVVWWFYFTQIANLFGISTWRKSSSVREIQVVELPQLWGCKFWNSSQNRCKNSSVGMIGTFHPIFVGHEQKFHPMGILLGFTKGKFFVGEFISPGRNWGSVGQKVWETRGKRNRESLEQ